MSPLVQCVRGTPDFGGKNDRDGKNHGRQGSPDKPGESRKIHQTGQKCNQHQNQDNSTQQQHGLCITDEIQQAEEYECDQQNVNDTQPVKTLKKEEDVCQKITHGSERIRRFKIGLRGIRQPVDPIPDSLRLSRFQHGYCLMA